MCHSTRSSATCWAIPVRKKRSYRVTRRKNLVDHLHALAAAERAAMPQSKETIMADDPTKTAEDRKLVSLEEPHEIQWWKKALNATEAELRAAVHQVGHSVQAVRDYLAKK